MDRPTNIEEGREVLSSLPHLDRRIANFSEQWLEIEPCTGAPHLPDDYLYKIGSCQVISNTKQMCVACRLRMAFFHCVYNGEAYDPSLGIVEE